MNKKLTILIALGLVSVLGFVSWRTGNASIEGSFFMNGEEALAKPFLSASPMINAFVILGVVAVVVVLVVWRRGLGG